jgi:hypothetical protein
MVMNVAKKVDKQKQGKIMFQNADMSSLLRLSGKNVL